MLSKENYPYYLTALGLFVLLKLGFTVADNDSMAFLLRPINSAIELLTGSKAIYFPDKGFYHERLDVLIDKSCSGFNYLLLSFVMLVFLTVKYTTKQISKACMVPVSMLAAYVLTIFANTSRIFISIVIEHKNIHFLQEHQAVLHEAIGVLTYLSFLVLTYLLTEKYLIKTNKHAKFTES